VTDARRLRLAERLYWSARKLKAAGLRHQHTDWPDACVNEEVRRIFRHLSAKQFLLNLPATPEQADEKLAR